MPKQYFYPVGFTVPVALAASFLIAYTVAPWAARRWIPQPPIDSSSAGGRTLPGGRFGKLYSIPARLLIGHPRREIVFVCATAFLCMSHSRRIEQPNARMGRRDGIPAQGQ